MSWFSLHLLYHKQEILVGISEKTPFCRSHYLFRNYRTITANPDVALTELVANAWDAGSNSVSIQIPSEQYGEIVIEDNGTGMSDEEFHSRWMTLNYDRQKRQGKDVSFPSDIDVGKRIAYGRNGVGRHGLLCFADTYRVETWQNGICNTYEISVSEGNAPYKITTHRTGKKDGHGTRLSTLVCRHLPKADSMADVLSARFLYDPNFILKINDQVIDLAHHRGNIFEKNIDVNQRTHLKMTVIDSGVKTPPA